MKDKSKRLKDGEAELRPASKETPPPRVLAPAPKRDVRPPANPDEGAR